jgi:hypothetical protein
MVRVCTYCFDKPGNASHFHLMCGGSVRKGKKSMVVVLLNYHKSRLKTY